MAVEIAFTLARSEDARMHSPKECCFKRTCPTCWLLMAGGKSMTHVASAYSKECCWPGQQGLSATGKGSRHTGGFGEPALAGRTVLLDKSL